MTIEEIRDRIAEIDTEIDSLPAGSVSTKTVKGKKYFYHRWTENRVLQEKYLSEAEVPALREQIERRKQLTAEKRELKKQLPKERKPKTPDLEFSTYVRVGKALDQLAASVKGYKKRKCFDQLAEYVYGDSHDKVFILYGLRRTGKTTMIRQLISEMSVADKAKTALIQVSPADTLSTINKDMKALEAAGYKYVFIDEVTLMEDFIEGAALFSDIYAACGMKIVLSGTDSLGFRFTELNELYDRCFMLHTTFISYKEFEDVLGIQGIDEYIRYGGTMSLGGINYNENATFATEKSTNDYVDSAIARNVQHSLKFYQDGGHFRHLIDLYEKNELTSAINRVVEDINHRFTVEVLTRDFKSSDLSISARNLRRDRTEPTEVLDRIDIESVTERLRQTLEIRNKAEQTVEISETHSIEIQEYLALLDLIYKVDVNTMTSKSVVQRTVIAQPGMRYCQVEALIRSLMEDETFSDLGVSESNRVTGRILTEVRGRMMEDIVLLETKLKNPKKQVFVLQFAIGEYDMVVADREAETCEIYEIKHSTEVVPEQTRYLRDEEKCSATAHRYGEITGKYVLYRGENQEVDGVQYLNVEEYLKSLGE